MFGFNSKSFIVGWLFGGGLALAGWAWSGDGSAQDVVRLWGSGVATFMGVDGELPPCSYVEVKQPSVIADFGQPAGFNRIDLKIDKCSGAGSMNGGMWKFDSSDSWKTREPLKIASSISGGHFKCDISWMMVGRGSGPVDFIAEWRIVRLQGDRCGLVSKR
jgi:hypothetical protein